MTDQEFGTRIGRVCEEARKQLNYGMSGGPSEFAISGGNIGLVAIALIGKDLIEIYKAEKAAGTA